MTGSCIGGRWHVLSVRPKPGATYAMIRHQGYTFRLRGLSADQRQAFTQQAGQCRWLWNEFVAFELARHKAGQKIGGLKWRGRVLTILRSLPDQQWLAEGSSAAQQRVLRNLGAAWQRYWDDRKLPKSERRGIEPPNFKKKGNRDCFGWSGQQHVELDQTRNRVKLPKIGWVRYRNSRRVEGIVMNATVRRVGRKWDISFGTEREVVEPQPRHHVRPLGLDLGIKHLATRSDGEHVAGPRAQRAAAKAKAKAQRIAARRVKGSTQRKRQLWKVAKIDRRTANIRRNDLHKLTTDLAKNHGFVGVEALRVKAMSGSAKGTVAKPGKNVAAKRGLNREILDQGWGEMRRQLAYKLGWSGGVLIAVDPRNTSRRCSACGHTSRDNRTSQAGFACVACGHAINADVNAAKNILAAAMAAMAAGHVAENAGGGDGACPALEPSSLALRARIPVP